MGKKQRQLVKKLIRFVRSFLEWRNEIAYPDADNGNDRNGLREGRWEHLRWNVFCL